MQPDLFFAPRFYKGKIKEMIFYSRFYYWAISAIVLIRFVSKPSEKVKKGF
jgi:hypothetical protein